MRPFLSQTKQKATCGVCGNPVTIPPGVWYRGVPMHKQEAERRRREDYDREVKSPALSQLGKEIEQAMDVGEES